MSLPTGFVKSRIYRLLAPVIILSFGGHFISKSRSAHCQCTSLAHKALSAAAWALRPLKAEDIESLPIDLSKLTNGLSAFQN